MIETGIVKRLSEDSFVTMIGGPVFRRVAEAG